MWCGGFRSCSEEDKCAMVWACPEANRVTPCLEEDMRVVGARHELPWTETDGEAIINVEHPTRGNHRRKTEKVKVSSS